MTAPHLLVHDKKDTVGVVVVEGLKAGTDMTCVVTADDSAFPLTARMDVPIGHKIALDRHQGRRYGVEIRPGHRQGGRADRQGRARPRPQPQDQALVSVMTGSNGKSNRNSPAIGARTAASACATTSSSCRSTISPTPPARRSPTTSRARWRCRTPMAGCSSAPTSSCSSAPSSAPAPTRTSPRSWSSASRTAGPSAWSTASRKTGKPVDRLRHRGPWRHRRRSRAPHASPRITCSGPPSCKREECDISRAVGLDQVRRERHHHGARLLPDRGQHVRQADPERHLRRVRRDLGDHRRRASRQGARREPGDRREMVQGRGRPTRTR